MGTAIIVVILIIVGVIAVKSYAKKLTSGCCGTGSNKEMKVDVADKDPGHYPYFVKLQIEGMTCNHCKLRVENALNRMENVWAEVHLQEGCAVVRMKQKISEFELRRAVDGAGYLVTNVQYEDKT